MCGVGVTVPASPEPAPASFAPVGCPVPPLLALLLTPLDDPPEAEGVEPSSPVGSVPPLDVLPELARRPDPPPVPPVCVPLPHAAAARPQATAMLAIPSHTFDLRVMGPS